MTPLVDIEHLRSWIGREEVICQTLTSDLAEQFCATLDLADYGFAPGDAAPPLLHFCLAQPRAFTSGLAQDGHAAKGEFLPPVPFPSRMWAGGELSLSGALRIGDAVTRRSRIVDVALKDGRSGPLCFVTVSHHLNVADRRVIEEVQNIVYRRKDGAARLSTGAAPRGENAVKIDIGAALLFRYSAITFNAHRIHYDRDYAVEIEHYPGLVVHGPLQATLLYHFALKLRQAPPSRFTFRSHSPLFDDGPFYLHAQPEEGGLRLWSARENGPVAMQAKAMWS